jgi:hypothetical protein
MTTKFTLQQKHFQSLHKAVLNLGYSSGWFEYITNKKGKELNDYI